MKISLTDLVLMLDAIAVPFIIIATRQTAAESYPNRNEGLQNRHYRPPPNSAAMDSAREMGRSGVICSLNGVQADMMPGQKYLDPFTGNNVVSGKARQVKENKGRHLAGADVGFQLDKSRARLIIGAESVVGINADVCQSLFLRVLGQSGLLLGNRSAQQRFFLFCRWADVYRYGSYLPTFALAAMYSLSRPAM